MAHYAFLDENNIVTEVIVGVDEFKFIDGLSPEIWYSNFRGQKCVRTSYNGLIRKNFAGIGWHYDPIKDIFYSFQPFPSWILNDDAYWVAPVEHPEEGAYKWNEELLNWTPYEDK